MSLAPSTRFGSYEVVNQIGIGGMGEVYRARDAKLNRDVALKVLPDSFATDPDRLARFQREAHVLASLNHPNIAAIYGVEEVPSAISGYAPVRALVMELVDGPTLAERIASERIPLDEAVALATQIAEALGAAHDQGIVHRDLKPANIKVKTDGTVKVLDFGLAKAVEPAAARSSDAVSHSPTITTPAMTQIGVMLGTAAYMSPEQAKGRQADKRSDVWAFGCVFYEMVTGQRAFAEDDVSETLAAVLKGEPDWARLPADMPHPIRTLIQRCLVKDRRQRVADISTAKFVLCELNNLGLHSATTKVLSPPHSRWQRVALPLAAAAVTAFIVSAGAWALRPAADAPVVARFSFPLPERVVLSGTRQALAISGDGRRLVYAADSRMFIRSIDELEAHGIPGTEATSAGGLLNPMFAPDGQSLGFFPQGDGQSAQTTVTLRRIPIIGGAASTMATMGPTFGASWSAEGVVVGQADGIVLVPTNGAMKQIVKTAPDERIYGPSMLPGGRTVIFTIMKTAPIAGDAWDKAQVVAQSLTDGTRKVLIDGGSDGRYLSSGHLLYGVSGTMFAAPFDAGTVTVTGTAVPVLVGVRRATGRFYPARHLAVSDTGTLVYIPGPATTSAVTGLVIGDGRVAPDFLKIPPAEYTHPRVSPDGRTVAVARGTGQESDIATYDLSGATEIRRLTFGGRNSFPVWSRDSKRIAFQSARDGSQAIYMQSADGSNVAELLTKPAQGEEHRPESWSRDGSRLLFSILKDGKFTLWVLTVATKTSEPFGRVESAEPLSASFSADGRWVVYASSPVAGGMMSPNRGIFVQPFPPTGQLHQVPKKFLDFHPVWEPDGKGIYFIPGASRPPVLVPISTRSGVSFGTAVDIPRGPQPGVLSTDVRGYDILPDGRFISLASTLGDGSGSASSNEIRVVVNWFEELTRLVPVK